MSLDRLCAYFGFSRVPFGRGLAPSALFRSTAHCEALARLDWLIAQAGLGVLTGEVGAGKTVAVRAATAALEPSRHQVIYLPNPAIGSRGILSAVVTGLGGSPRFHRCALVPQAAEALAVARTERGRQVTLLVDEAHLLGLEQLEDLRMLSSADMDATSAATIILIGQPILRRRLRQGVFAAIDQRIALRIHIEGMDLKETGEYLRHHLTAAGRADTLFSDDAIAAIHQGSRGLPREVNNLALAGLIATFAANKTIVDAGAAKMALAEVAGE
jgi:type II secretory pathway predicted ATPase ExeA